MSARGPTSIDQHVGARLRLRRSLMEMSQSELGEKLGVTFQQVQKYEKGTNRVGASRLQNIASILNVPVSFFFEDAPDGSAASAPKILGGLRKVPQNDVYGVRECLRASRRGGWGGHGR